jgi:hypothetical protein
VRLRLRRNDSGGVTRGCYLVATGHHLLCRKPHLRLQPSVFGSLELGLLEQKVIIL